MNYFKESKIERRLFLALFIAIALFQLLTSCVTTKKGNKPGEIKTRIL